MSTFLVEQGVPHEQDVINPSNYVFSFPQKAPENAVCTDDVGAMKQLKLWHIYQEHWCEHKPSITVYYRDDEFLEVGSWLYRNFDSVSGVSFLPRSEHTYAQAPYQDITEEEYEKLSSEMPDINWSLLSTYEYEDNTEGSQTLACTGNNCEL